MIAGFVVEVLPLDHIETSSACGCMLFEQCIDWHLTLLVSV
jgi:hypothetical protein